MEHHMSVSVDCGGGGDRFPQWSVEETRDLLMIRGELDRTFMERKRNKVLWELISTKMKELRGYNRTADQCKCKWKNLVTRYKGIESMEQAQGGLRQQFPFYKELQAIFTDRMQRMEGSSNSNKRDRDRMMHYLSSDDDDDDDDDDEDHDTNINIEESTAEASAGSNKKKQRKKSIINISNTNKESSSISSSLKDMLEELMKQHMQIEMQWMKLYQSKEEERRTRETEWRRRMEALERERIMFDTRWREREEQRRITEETRSEKRDALITILLNKLA